MAPMMPTWPIGPGWPLPVAAMASETGTIGFVGGMQVPLIGKFECGYVLGVLATDPASVKDFRNYCETTGHALVAFSEAAGVYSFVIQKKADAPS